MSSMAKGPQGVRRGRGARERLLEAADALFRGQGINSTGMNELCATAGVSKRTAYQHFAGKDELVAAHLRHQDPETMPEVFERSDLAPRDRLLAAFEHAGKSEPTPLCPFIGASVEIADTRHPARMEAKRYKRLVAERFTAAAREAGAADPELLGEQLALLLDGASARTRALDADTDPIAASIAATLIDQALPAPPV